MGCLVYSQRLTAVVIWDFTPSGFLTEDDVFSFMVVKVREVCVHLQGSNVDVQESTWEIRQF